MADLQRFLDAQDPVIEQVYAELSAGQKRSHWMWYIFPQIAGLGWSATALRFAIANREEAAAYLNHPILGARLRKCVQLLLAVDGRNINEILGYPDDLKFRSSLTLFAESTADNQLFRDALAKFYQAEPDPLTLERLAEYPDSRPL